MIDEPDDGVTAMVMGHLVIRDVSTGEVLLSRRDIVVQPMDGIPDDE